jgi:glycosyltransferase involved in cell wall biosynthesis
MRIALIVTEYVTEANFDGGLANYTYRIALSLSQSGHEPVVFVEADQNQHFIHDGIEVNRVKYRRVFWLSVLNVLTWRRMKRFFNYLRQSWNLNACLKRQHRLAPFALVQYTHLSGTGLFRPRHIPTVARLSSYTPLWFQFGEYSDRSRFQVWQQIVVENWALKRVDAVFGPCRMIASVVQKQLEIPVQILESPFVIPDMPEDASLLQNQLLDKRYLLFFGRLNRPKGVLVIAAMLNQLMQRHPDLFFVFIGRETTGYEGRPIIEHIYEQAGEFRERVLYLGRVPQSQLFPVIRNAAAITLPALIENFPNTCLEAMALGQVVVVTRGTGFDQLISHRESGLMCRADDPANFLETVEIALQMSSEDREVMGRAAQSRLESLKPEKVAARHLEFYRNVIERIENKND